MNSVSIISKVAAGGGSIIMAPYASPPMPSWRPSAPGFPPLSLCPSSEPLDYPEVSRREGLPVRPERHVPTSIATLYRLHGRALLAATPCLACGSEPDVIELL